MLLYDSIAAFFAETKRQLEAAKADGKLSNEELWQLFYSGVKRAVQTAKDLPLAGADKKAAVLDAAGKLYDTVIAPIDIPYIPAILENSVVDPMLKTLYMDSLSGLIEIFVADLPAAG